MSEPSLSRSWCSSDMDYAVLVDHPRELFDGVRSRAFEWIRCINRYYEDDETLEMQENDIPSIRSCTQAELTIAWRPVLSAVTQSGGVLRFPSSVFPVDLLKFSLSRSILG